jgi:signal transduction histidine kinase
LSDGSLLTVAVDTAGIDDVRSQLRTVLIPLLLGALVLAGLLLTIVTRTALRPLDRMTRLAQGITRGQRGRRLAPERTDTELGRTAAAFDEMLDALDGAESRALASESRTRRFVADAAHELRTPIAGVQAASEAMLAAGPATDAVGRERLQVLVLGEARRASRLVDDLLSLASIDSGLELRLEPVDLTALLNAQAEQLRLLAPGLCVEVVAPPYTVLADQLRLTQVIANLFENARRYVPRPGRVMVRGTRHGSGVDVLVIDDGPGIAAQDRERIFDRLVRLDDARARDNGSTGTTVGSGLGLAIARGIARSHGGELTCVPPTDPWTGAAFLLHLPG